MQAFELDEGEVFFIKDHPLGPRVSLVCISKDERGVLVHLEGDETVKAVVQNDAEVLRIFEVEEL